MTANDTIQSPASITDKYGRVPSRFSPDAFGGDGLAASNALDAHMDALQPGVRVRVYRAYEQGAQIGEVGTVGEHAGGRRVFVRIDGLDGLDWELEAQNIEVLTG